MNREHMQENPMQSHILHFYYEFTVTFIKKAEFIEMISFNFHQKAFYKCWKFEIYSVSLFLISELA